jgi:diacylglycerol kinase family enzyme
MKKAMVLHNPSAGEGDTTERELVKQIESAGFKCSYSSTKQFRWENIETEKIDFLVLAGGDGTVRKVADELLDRKVTEKKLPLGLLPFGTANNIAKTLGLSDNPQEIIEGWHTASRKSFDVGIIDGLDEPAFFLEGFGYGLFPKLMLEMKKQNKNDIEDPREQLRAALDLLYELVQTAPVKKCKLQVDGIDCSGEFLLVEVMNIRSIGPNLHLAPDADPGDGKFDIVLITEKQRTHLAEYVRKKLEGEEVPFDFPLLKGRELVIFWDGKHVHVDDEYHKLDDPISIKISLREGLLEFLTPPLTGVR